MHSHQRHLSCVLTLALCSAAITHAAAEYRVGGAIVRTVGSSFVRLDEYGFTSIGSPTQGGVLYNGENDTPSTLATGSSSASIFGLGAGSTARAIRVSNSINLSYAFNTGTSASAFWSDFIVTGPAGPSTVQISVNALIEGSTLTGMSTSPSPTARLDASVQFGIFSGFSGGFSNIRFGGTYGESFTQSGGLVFDRTGLLADFDGSTVVTTPLFSVPVNTPFAIEMQLSTFANVQSNFGDIFFMEAASDFSNTASFATDRPAFNLPAGYTINSVDAGIMNNAYVAIPETSSVWLSALSVGVIVVGVFARRHRQRVLLSEVAG